MNNNKIKIILFDVDGVLIRLPHYFGQELENNGYKNVVESLKPFFYGEGNDLCGEGKANAEIVIKPFLENFGWKGTVEDFFKQQFQFEKDFLDNNFIKLIQQLRKKNIKCYLSTDQEKNRAKFLLNELNFQNIFDGYFISCYMGYRKGHGNFWDHVLKGLQKDFPGIKANEITFFDDKQSNVDIASKYGIQSFLFKDMEQFNKDLASLNLN